MKKIPLTGKYGLGKYALVDDDLFPFLSGMKWRAQRRKKKSYSEDLQEKKVNSSTNYLTTQEGIMSNYTKEQVEQIIRAYHKWLGENGVNDTDGLPSDFNISDLDVYNGHIEDADSMPFSELVGDFFAEAIQVDEEGHPVTTAFEETLKAFDPQEERKVNNG
jgi:hypothetical protein